MVAVASLTDFAKLDTLRGDRAANNRVRKISYHLELARRAGFQPSEIIAEGYELNGGAGSRRAQESTTASLANHRDLSAWGCFDAEGMTNLRRGRAPTIKRGLFTGQIVTVDHTLPRSIVPELDEALYNLRVMPEAANQSKGNSITPEAIETARGWQPGGLPSEQGFEAVGEVR